MKVSVITVVLNNKLTIADTIETVRMQQYRPIEHIIVDGGSTDGTLDVINRYKDSIARLVSEPANGVYDAMNKGIELSSADIVGFLNADDFYADENAVGQVVEAMQANNTDCCYGDLEYVARDNPKQTVRRWKSRAYRDGLFEKGWHPPHPTFFAKKYLFDKFGRFDLDFRISADYELMLRFLKKGAIKSCYIPRVLVKMRLGGASNKNLWQIIKANIECFQACRKNGLRVSPAIMFRKPFSKLAQYVRKTNRLQ